MIGPAHHVGVAVRSLDAALADYRNLGFEAESVEDVPAQGVRVAFLGTGPTRIELLESLSPDGVIARFGARHSGRDASPPGKGAQARGRGAAP